MPRKTLNLGILAHVDAGKTTLTEQLLHAAGVIDAVGSVDRGTTQTDTLALERQRGITIKSAVVSFAIDDVAVNLVDTPGHPDFIAEVERVLGVLDGVVLVVSAVEGIQAQTRILMRALQRLGLPTLFFLNKVDRAGADCARTLDEVRRKLAPTAVAMTSVKGAGNRAATVSRHRDTDPAFTEELVGVLAEGDERLLHAYLGDEPSVTPRRLHEALVAQTRRAVAYPVFCGSAITGAGVDALAAGIAELLPARAGDADGVVSGTVFKIERGPTGDRIAYVRMFSGTLRTRDRVHFGGGREGKVTAVSVFDGSTAVRRDAVSAGEIAKLWGLAEVEIGDGLGDEPRGLMRPAFPPPTLESVVAPLDGDDRQRLRLALAQLAEQDPLIDVRQDDSRGELTVRLYGDVQKEVIQATLAADYGLEVAFGETTPVYVERPIGTGEATEVLHAASNPYFATIAFRVEPAPPGSGVSLRLAVDSRAAPLYLYKTLESFRAHMDRYVRETLREGLFGWEVTDCSVTMTRCDYSVPDGPPSKRGPLSTSSDYRKLTPLVLMQALDRARTVVCEPTLHVSLEIPADTLGGVLAALGRLGAAIDAPSVRGDRACVETVLSTERARDLQRQLSNLTRGEGVLEAGFAGYEPVAGTAPARPRTTPNPLNLAEYLAH